MAGSILNIDEFLEKPLSIQDDIPPTDTELPENMVEDYSALSFLNQVLIMKSILRKGPESNAGGQTTSKLEEVHENTGDEPDWETCSDTTDCSWILGAGVLALDRDLSDIGEASEEDDPKASNIVSKHSNADAGISKKQESQPVFAFPVQDMEGSFSTYKSAMMQKDEQEEDVAKGEEDDDEGVEKSSQRESVDEATLAAAVVAVTIAILWALQTRMM